MTAVALMLASCGPSALQTTPLSTALPLSATQTSSVSGGALQIALPATQEIVSGTIASPASSFGSTGAVFTISVQPAPPAALPSVPVSSSSFARRPLGLTNVSVIGAISLTSSASIAFGSAPSFTLTLPQSAIVPGATYTLAYYDSVTGWNLLWAGPATLSGTTLTFASNEAPFTLVANTPANFALLRSTATATAAPTAAATPTVTPTPAALNITSSSVALVIGGSPTTQTVSVSQSGLAPTFTPLLTCTIAANSLPGTVATIAAVGSATASAPGAAVNFAVAVAAVSPTAGTCSGSISSSAGGVAATFTVTVTETNAVIQSLGHR